MPKSTVETICDAFGFCPLTKTFDWDRANERAPEGEDRRSRHLDDLLLGRKNQHAEQAGK